MSVDFFWRRTPPTLVQGLDDTGLSDLVPSWSDDRYKDEQQAGTTIGVEDTAELISRMLRLGAGDGPDAEAASLPINAGGRLHGGNMVVALTPREVVIAAEFLSRVHPAAWVVHRHLELAQAASDMGYRRPFDDEWAQQVAQDADDLIELFRHAAGSGEAIIIKVVA